MKKIFLISTIFLTCVILFTLPFFIKITIVCKSQYGTCPQQVLDKLNSFNGKSLFSAKKSIRNIFKNEFLISNYSLQYKIPNLLQVNLIVKKAVAAFKNSGSGSIILADGYGLVLSKAADSALPVIIINDNLPEIGQTVNSKYISALKLAGGVYQMYQVRESIIQDESLLVELPGQIRVIFPLDGDNEILLGSLSLIYSKVREGGNLAEYSQIDLRFVNPVLR